MIAFFIVCVLVVVWIRHRAHRRRNLAGLNSVKPVFMVDPPTRRLGSRRRELL